MLPSLGPCPGHPGLILMGRKRGQGGQITRHSQNSWTDNTHVSLQANATLTSVLTRSCSSCHQGDNLHKLSNMDFPLASTCAAFKTDMIACLIPSHCALATPPQDYRSSTHLCWGRRLSHSLPARHACCHQREEAPPGSRWHETGSGSEHWPTPASH